MTEVLFLTVSEYEEERKKQGKRRLNVSGVLRILGISRSGYTHFKKKVPSNRELKKHAIKERIREIHKDSHQNYGSYTKNGFMSSKWKPSVIVKVDSMTDEFSSKEGRQKLLEQYVKASDAGEPWLIPAEQFEIETVKPLSLADLAISDSVEIDKRTVASIIGVPPFVLGVGDYNQTAWNAFISNTVRVIAEEIEQELTKKLILNPKWYFKFNILSLMDWDVETIANVFGSLSDRGFVTGNEVRDRIGMSPAAGLDEFRILENYLPYDMSGKQKKLVQPDEE